MLRNISTPVVKKFFYWTPLLALFVVLACDSGTDSKSSNPLNSKSSNPLNKEEAAPNLTFGDQDGSSVANAIVVSGTAGNTLYGGNNFNPATLVKGARGTLSYYTVAADDTEIPISNPATFTLPTSGAVTFVIKAAGDDDYSSKSLYFRITVAPIQFSLVTQAELTSAGDGNTIDISNNAAGAARDGSNAAQSAVINNSSTALVDGESVDLSKFVKNFTNATYDVFAANGTTAIQLNGNDVKDVDIATAHPIVGNAGLVFKITVPASDTVRAAATLYLRVQAVSSFALATQDELANNDTIITSNNAAGAARDGSNAAQSAVINNSSTALVDGESVDLSKFVKNFTNATYDVFAANGTTAIQLNGNDVKDVDIATAHPIVGNAGLVFKITVPASDTVRAAATLYLRVQAVSSFALATQDELAAAGDGYTIDISNNAAGAARDGSNVAQAAVINNSSTALVDGESVDLSKFVKNFTNATYDVFAANGTTAIQLNGNDVKDVDIATAHPIVGNAGLVFKITVPASDTTRAGLLYLRVQAVSSLATQDELAAAGDGYTIDISNNAAGAARDGSNVAQAAVINNSSTALVDGESVDLSKFVKNFTNATYDVFAANGTTAIQLNGNDVKDVDIATAHPIVGNAGLVFKITVPASDTTRAGLLYLRVQAVSSFALATQDELANNDTIITSNNAAGAARDGSNAAQSAVINNSSTALVDGESVDLSKFVKNFTNATYDVFAANGTTAIQLNGNDVKDVDIATAHPIVGNAGLVFKITVPASDTTRAGLLYLRVQAVSSLATQDELAAAGDGYTIDISNNAAGAARDGSNAAQSAVINNSSTALVDGESVDLSKFVKNFTNATYDVFAANGTTAIQLNGNDVKDVDIATAHPIVGNAGLVFKITVPASDTVRAAATLYLRVQAVSSLTTQDELAAAGDGNTIDISNNAAGAARDGSNVAQAAVINNSSTALVDGESVDLSKFVKNFTNATYDVFAANGTTAIQLNGNDVKDVDIATAHPIVGNAGLVFKITVPASDTTRAGLLYLRVQAVSSFALATQDELANNDTIITSNNAAGAARDGSNVAQAAVINNSSTALVDGESVDLSKFVKNFTNATYDVFAANGTTAIQLNGNDVKDVDIATAHPIVGNAGLVFKITVPASDTTRAGLLYLRVQAVSSLATQDELAAAGDGYTIDISNNAAGAARDGSNVAQAAVIEKSGIPFVDTIPVDLSKFVKNATGATYDVLKADGSTLDTPVTNVAITSRYTDVGDAGRVFKITVPASDTLRSSTLYLRVKAASSFTFQDANGYTAGLTEGLSYDAAGVLSGGSLTAGTVVDIAALLKDGKGTLVYEIVTSTQADNGQAGEPITSLYTLPTAGRTVVVRITDPGDDQTRASAIFLSITST